jgi:hypothetical protein
VSVKDSTRPLVGVPYDIFWKVFDGAGDPKGCETYYVDVVGSYEDGITILADSDGSFKTQVIFNKPDLNKVNIGAGAFSIYIGLDTADNYVLSKNWENIDFDWG